MFLNVTLILTAFKTSNHNTERSQRQTQILEQEEREVAEIKIYGVGME
jgi:hypothetical protein